MKTYTGKEYLQIVIANHFGLDKEEFPTRIAWVEKNETELETLAPAADDYFQYSAAVMAYRKAQQGEATGYLAGLDTCSSGPQILSVTIGCKIGAMNTGAIGNQIKDVYGIVTGTMADLLNEEMLYTRKQVKYSFMP